MLGGPHATILHREILAAFPAFDIVVRNEAELSINKLLAAMDAREFSDIQGISYRNRGGEIVCHDGSPLIDDLDCLPVPAYDCYPIAQLGLETIRVEAGRGCPFSCTFCSTASFFGRSYRLKSTARLLSELDFLHQAFGYTDFKLNHDLFTVNRKKVSEFCEAVRARNYTWSCSARVDCVDELLLVQMHDAGCRNVYFGIETASARMQEISRKRLDVALVEPTLEVTRTLGIKTTTSFITGYPEETQEDQDQTLDLAGRLFCRPDNGNTSQIHLLTPEPGTELLARYRSALVFDAYVSEFNFPLLEPDEHALIADHPGIFSNHHYYPSTLGRDRHVFVTSAWTVLWEIGPLIVGYLLCAFEGRLSRFMGEAFTWRMRTGSERSNVTADDIQAFLAARFGGDHHLVSLFRYARALVAIQKPAGAADAERSDPAIGDPRDVAMAMGRGVAMLRRIHDCAALLGQIRKAPDGPPLTRSAAGGRQNMLLVRRPAAKRDTADDDAVSMYLIDENTAELLAHFEDPKSYWQCCREIADGDDRAPFPDWTDLASLCEIGVLEARFGMLTPTIHGTASHS